MFSSLDNPSDLQDIALSLSGALTLVGLGGVSLVSPFPLIVCAVAVSLFQLLTDTRIAAELFGYNTMLLDVVFVAGAAAAAIRLVVRHRFVAIEVWLIALAAMTFLSFAIGVGRYGIAPAALQFRAALYVVSGLMLVVTFEWNDHALDRLAWIWVTGGVAAALFAAVGLLDSGLSLQLVIPLDRYDIRYRYEENRAISANAALFVAQAAVMLQFHRRLPNESAAKNVGSVLLMIVVVVVYHRSVWAAAAAGFLMVVLADRRRVAQIGVGMIGLLLCVGVLWVFSIVTDAVPIGQRLYDASIEPFSQNSSLAWRTTGWQAALAGFLSSDFATLLFGAGFGVGMDRVIDGAVIQVSLHNFYLETLLISGLFGLMLWSGLFGWLLMAMLRMGGGGRLLNPTAGIALVTMTIVFAFPYSPDYEQGILLGALVAFALRAPVAAPAPATAQAVRAAS